MQVLSCLRLLMDLESGMDAVLGVTKGSSGGRRQLEPAILRDQAAARRDQPATLYVFSGGLRQLVRCIDTKHESVYAKAVQAQALTMISAAALYSEEGHNQVLGLTDS